MDNRKIEGNFTFTGDTDFRGMVTGEGAVSEGAFLDLRGVISKDLTIEPGGKAVIRGMVAGSVFNNGGDLTVFGMISGQLMNNGGKTTIHSNSSIDGVIQP